MHYLHSEGQGSLLCCSLLLLLLSHISRVWLCGPIDGSPPGSPIPGILQARTLEWVAISFSNAWRWKVKVKSLSRVWLLETPRTVAHQAPLSTGFPRQEYWSGVPLPSPVLQSMRSQWVGHYLVTEQQWAFNIPSSMYSYWTNYNNSLFPKFKHIRVSFSLEAFGYIWQ